MKLIDQYILQAFLKPFISTFLIALFIFILQLVWLLFDDLAGKGITLLILLKFMFYVTVIAIPKAIPVAVLLGGIMTFGQLSENYEFAATKSSGISLLRLLRPIMIFISILGIINLLFLNNAYPWAFLKQKNLYINIKKRQPALALVPGTFNTDIDGYILKFDKKYGPKQNFLDNVLIYQTDKKNGSINTITATTGVILSEEGSKYLNLKLKNGNIYKEHTKRISSRKERMRSPFSKTHFDTYTVNLDISEFSLQDIEKENYKNDREMLSLNQLEHSTDSMKVVWDEYVYNRAQTISRKLNINELKDSTIYLDDCSLVLPLLDNFNDTNKETITNRAKSSVENTIENINNFKNDYIYKRKRLNLVDAEYHHRLALAFSVFLLFLIGAPLGALIQKGGFGLPMVFAIVIYMTYHFSSTFALNMSEQSKINDFWGGWSSTFMFLPFGLYLLISTSTDRGKINIAGGIQYLTKFFVKWFSSKVRTTNTK